MFLSCLDECLYNYSVSFYSPFSLLNENKSAASVEAVDDIDVNSLLVGRCRCVVEPECFFLQRVQVIGQEHRTVIHFQLSFAVRLEIAYLVGRRRKYQLKNIPSAD